MHVDEMSCARRKCATASRLTSRELLIIRRAKSRGLTFSPSPSISAGITFVGGLSATSICQLEVGTIRKANSSPDKVSERINPPFSLSLSLALILRLFLARFQRNCFLVLAFPRLIQLLDSLFSLLYRCFPSITIVHDNSCKAACEILNVPHCCSCKL